MTLSNMPPYEIVNELRKSRVADKHDSLVLLEGTSDRALWTGYTSKRCQLFPLHGKSKVVDVVELVNGRTTLNGIAGIVDPDFWLVEQDKRLSIENILFDNVPDVELMLLLSPALEKALRNTITDHHPDRIAHFSELLRNESMRLAIDFGYFRLVQLRRQKFDLKLRAVADSLSSYIDGVTLLLDDEKVADTLAHEGSRTLEAQVLETVRRFRQEIDASIQLCRGKDALSIMAFILPSLYMRTFGGDELLKLLLSQFQIDGDNHELARVLRMNFEYSDFQSTLLYDRILKWESDNIPFRIIKD